MKPTLTALLGNCSMRCSTSAILGVVVLSWLALTSTAAAAPGVVQGRTDHGAKDATAPPPVDPELRALLKQAATETGSFSDRFDAEVWLTDMSQRLAKKVPDAKYRVELLRAAHHEATRAGLKPELALAVIDVESNFNRFAISSAGARGLMQVMPFWLKEIGRPGDSLFSIQTNLRYGCTILKYYLDKERGNLRAALARYNGSQGQGWYPARVNLAYQKRWYPQ